MGEMLYQEDMMPDPGLSRWAMLSGRHCQYRARRGRRYLRMQPEYRTNYLHAWTGDGVKPATTRQQTRYAARRAGVVTGRTVAVLAQERQDEREEMQIRREMMEEYHRHDAPVF